MAAAPDGRRSTAGEVALFPLYHFLSSSEWPFLSTFPFNTTWVWLWSYTRTATQGMALELFAWAMRRIAAFCFYFRPRRGLFEPCACVLSKFWFYMGMCCFSCGFYVISRGYIEAGALRALCLCNAICKCSTLDAARICTSNALYSPYVQVGRWLLAMP